MMSLALELGGSAVWMMLHLKGECPGARDCLMASAPACVMLQGLVASRAATKQIIQKPQ